MTAIAESTDDILAQSSLALLRALQWEGVAMVEFRTTPENGRAVLMEVNGRYWGSISLPVIAGMDFPLLQWKLVHAGQSKCRIRTRRELNGAGLPVTSGASMISAWSQCLQPMLARYF